MIFKTKYDIGDKVWFANDDIAFKGEIAGVSITDYPSGSYIWYTIITKTETYCISEDECFRTLHEMLKVCE